MTDEPVEAEPGQEKRANKGAPGQPWQPTEQPYGDQPEQGGPTPGPTKRESTDQKPTDQ
jgi:hypothetical protein